MTVNSYFLSTPIHPRVLEGRFDSSLCLQAILSCCHFLPLLAPRRLEWGYFDP